MFKKLSGHFSGGSHGQKENAPAGGQPRGAAPTPAARLRPMAEYTALDPAFREADFSEKLANLYVQMQNGWTDQDIEPLKPYFTDVLFARMDQQLEQLRRRKQTNYVDRIAVLGVDLKGFLRQNGEDHIIAVLNTRIVDYTMDDESGEVVSGDRRKEKFMLYEWNLVRPSGVQTGQRSGTRRSVCPSCGAPLDANISARCPYCGGVLGTGSGDWVICGIKGLAQKTGR